MEQDADTYDYLILGAGTAGCVLANRLSADPSIRVCLIEAGPPDSSPYIHIPAAVGGLVMHPSLSWGFKTVPQAHMDGRQILLPRGKVIGGCSSTNGMVYNRGHNRDYDDWAELGNAGWSFSEVLPYFTRSENNEHFRDSPLHGVGGPMNVVNVDKVNPLVNTFLEATDSLQLPRCTDYNGIDPEGFGWRQATIRDGRRESEATAFLKPAGHRKNLTILTNAFTRKIVIENRRAVGADLDISGVTHRLHVRREVILSAGSYMSPSVLLHSGIGDGAALQALGIPVELDLPWVGKHLQDHLSCMIDMKTDNSESYGVSLKAVPKGIQYILQYALFRGGPFAGNLFEGVGFLKTDPNLERPDIQMVFQPARRNPSGFWIPFGHGYAINSVLLKPKSHGTVTITSPDPHVPPAIDPNYLSDPDDYAPLLRSLKLARRIMASPAFARLNGTEVNPGAGVTDDEGLKAHIRRMGSSVHHPVSTCRMGVDAESVVDPQLRLRGIEGLRVVDASVFPTIIGGNTNAPVVMVAEKAADMILGKAPPKPVKLPNAA